MGPLHGLRVIEFASIGPGPMCAMLLADQGADVVRIDRLAPEPAGIPVEPRFDVVAAPFGRQASGRDQMVDAAMMEGVSSLVSFFQGLSAAGAWDPARRGANLIDGGVPFYASCATAEGRFIAPGPLEPEMREALAAIFLTRTRAAWCELLEGSDACFAPVLSLDEAAGHPHAAARQAFADVAGLRQPAPAPRFGRSAAAKPRPAPVPGEHSTALLAEAGYNEEQIATLMRSGVVRQAGDPR